MQFKGRTEDADSVFLGTDFGKPGRKVAGKVIRTFDTENGPCYVLNLPEPITIGGDEFDQVIAEVKADPKHAGLLDPHTWAGPGSDPNWNELGERGRTAQLLFSSGLKSKARRFADCGCVAFRLICSNEPEQHGFYTPFNCGLRFCQGCAPKIFRQLFSRYVRPIAAYVSERKGQQGYTLAHFDFTIRASGDVPTPEEIKAFNKAILTKPEDVERPCAGDDRCPICGGAISDLRL